MYETSAESQQQSTLYDDPKHQLSTPVAPAIRRKDLTKSPSKTLMKSRE
jgi:hypothetical protein